MAMPPQIYNPDARVFVNHPKKSWVPAFVTSRDTRTGLYTVTDDDHDELSKVPDASLTPCREDLLNEGVDPVVDDLLFLTVLHDATLLRCLKARYMKDLIYTNIGAIAVALNPFNFKIPWYLDACMDNYLKEGDVIRHNLPHSWAIAHNTYHEMRNDKQPQTILVSGESGAGKTEACKMVMKYLGRVSMLHASDQMKDAADLVRQRIQQSSPILEGFGNAKTVRNDNSSRFGKFVKVKFHDGGHLTGAFTINYLLEKSRIVTAAENERVYHAFYLLTKGSMGPSLGVQGPKAYRSTNSGKCVDVPGMDDAALYDECREAFDIMGLDDATQTRLWSVVAGCLMLLNVEIVALDADSSAVADKSRQELARGCELWGVPVESFERELVTTTTTVRGETFVMRHRQAQAIDMRDSIVKHMYDKLFSWIVSKINESTDDGAEAEQWIGVLDIFGFEDFKVNSFEQVCINLTNETLQNHYNNYIFTKDMAECRAEGIAVDDIKCPDNMECLKLVTDSRGILGLLDDECRLGTGSDQGFLEKVTHHCQGNAFFERKPMMRDSFTVMHYAGNVTYTVGGFLEKNRDTLKDDFRAIMQLSTNALAAQLLPPPVERVGKLPTVGGFFKLQLNELMAEINATNPHWIRCIKPHPAKKPLKFDGVSVTQQLQSSGVLGTVKIRKAGFPVRLTYRNFLLRYKILTGPCPADAALAVEKEYCRKAMKASRTSTREVQLGKTRVFMKSEAYFLLEQAREEASIKYRLQLQACARALVSEMAARKRRWAEAAVVVQGELRDYLRRSAEVRRQRREARERLLAQQKIDRHEFDAQATALLNEIVGDETVARERIVQTRRAHRQWLEDKQVLDAQERQAMMAVETRARQDLFSEFKAYLTAQTPTRAGLYLAATPGEELAERRELIAAEARAYQALFTGFREYGAALFRLEVEREERRARRLQQRLEDVAYGEMLQRMQLFPEFQRSLYRAVVPFGSTLTAIKQYAEMVARRTVKRGKVRLSQKEAENFSTRHPRDHTRLARELTAIQVGSRHDADASYRRVGDKTAAKAQFAARDPWRGVSNVPDLDQVAGTTVKSKKPTAAAAAATTPGKAAAASPGRSFRSGSPSSTPRRVGFASLRGSAAPAVTADPIKTAGVFETFRDKNDEAQFLRMRHLLAKDFRALHEAGQYGGIFINETEIPDKRTFFSAQDKLQLLVQEHAQGLVAKVRRLNKFCLTHHILEQDRTTGQWLAFSPVAKPLVATYPPCNDWRALRDEVSRLEYAVQNYKAELVKVVRGCIARGAKLPPGLEVTDETKVDAVHEAYFELRGHLETCQRCLYPMASKATLIALKVLWPRVQVKAMPDRCTECNTNAFDHPLQAAEPVIPASAGYNLAATRRSFAAGAFPEFTDAAAW